MTGVSAPGILRAALFHVPGNPFQGAKLAAHSDGALAIAGGRVLAAGDYSDVAAQFPQAVVDDRRGSYVLPGLIDTHVHFPQVRIIGALGHSLLDWLRQVTLPEEARLADPTYAAQLAHEFVRALACNGTTTALVFGSHFEQATEALFRSADAVGVRVFSGLVFGDRGLLPELHQSPDQAYRAASQLIGRFHSAERPRYVVTPRFALSSTPAMLEVCRTLLQETPDLRFTTHLNENLDEVRCVRELFPRAKDYLDVYESHGLVSRRAVLAHGIHSSDDEVRRLAQTGASISHCPASNAALGSGIFPMCRHVEAGVHFALGTDVGAGTGFSMLKETLQAHLMQRLAPEPMQLKPVEMLYLATRAGAEALCIEDETGDFAPGKSADYLCLKPKRGSVLEGALRHAGDESRVLATLFTLATESDISEVAVAGRVVSS